MLIVEPGAFRTGFAGDAMKHMPVIAAYDKIVGGTREFAKGMDNTQDGDPFKAASAIDAALAADQTPLRLQLGGDAIASVKAHSEKLLADMAEWEAVGLNTKFDRVAV